MYGKVEEITPMPNFPVKSIEVVCPRNGGLDGRCSQYVCIDVVRRYGIGSEWGLG